jgi:hypothetical protein
MLLMKLLVGMNGAALNRRVYSDKVQAMSLHPSDNLAKHWKHIYMLVFFGM